MSPLVPTILVNNRASPASPGPNYDFVRAEYLWSQAWRLIKPKLPVDAIAALRARGLQIRIESNFQCGSGSGSGGVAAVVPDSRATIADCDGVFEDPRGRPGPLTIRLRSSAVDTVDAPRLLIHEIFHAVHFLLNPDESPWIREGLAQLFEFLAAAKFPFRNFTAALDHPGTPLIADYSVERIDPRQYGHDLQYFYYVWLQCGGDQVFWDLARAKTLGLLPPARLLGVDGIDFVLKAAPKRAKEQCSGFAASALNAEVARIHNHEWSGSPDEARYFLWDTTRARPAPEASIPATDLVDLLPYRPVVLNGSASLPAVSVPGLRMFWLHGDFPYEVVSKRPTEIDETWRLLLLRQ